MDKIPIETTDEESVIRFRDCFSVRYIQSAALLCRLGYEIEKEYERSGDTSPELILRHETFILNSVLSTVAFLESAVNELYSDATDGAYFYIEKKNEVLLQTIGEKWRNRKNFDRAPMLDKYQKILAVAGDWPFDEGDEAFANVRILTEIRNHLMHYRREWVVLGRGQVPGKSEGATADKFEKILKKKFAINPLAAMNQPFFPEKCLGHGCAEWAIVNSLIFTYEFFRRLDLPAPYEGIREDLAIR